MNTDRYTKAVLTVIAGCLLWICATGVAPRVEAQEARVRFPGPVQPVVIVGTGSMDRAGNVDVTFTLDRGRRTDPTVPVSLPYSPASPLPTHVINMAGAPVSVEIAAVKKPADWDPIRVKVEPVPLQAKPGVSGGGR